MDKSTKAKEEIKAHIELLQTGLDLIYVSGMVEMAYELGAITHDERAEFLTEAQLVIVRKTAGK